YDGNKKCNKLVPGGLYDEFPDPPGLIEFINHVRDNKRADHDTHDYVDQAEPMELAAQLHLYQEAQRCLHLTSKAASVLLQTARLYPAATDEEETEANCAGRGPRRVCQ
ncbi:hypothetical protein AaE_013107, partial [Aphanomyces astaci]